MIGVSFAAGRLYFNALLAAPLSSPEADTGGLLGRCGPLIQAQTRPRQQFVERVTLRVFHDSHIDAQAGRGNHIDQSVEAKQADLAPQ